MLLPSLVLTDARGSKDVDATRTAMSYQHYPKDPEQPHGGELTKPYYQSPVPVKATRPYLLLPVCTQDPFAKNCA